MALSWRLGALALAAALSVATLWVGVYGLNSPIHCFVPLDTGIRICGSGILICLWIWLAVRLVREIVRRQLGAAWHLLVTWAWLGNFLLAVTVYDWVHLGSWGPCVTKPRTVLREDIRGDARVAVRRPTPTGRVRPTSASAGCRRGASARRSTR